MNVPLIAESGGEPEFDILAAGFGPFAATGEGAVAVMNQGKTEIRSCFLYDSVEFSDVAHVRRARPDANEEAGKGEFADKHFRKVGKAGANLAEIEEPVSVTVLREGRSEKDDFAIIEDLHGARVEGVGTDRFQSVLPILRHDSRINVDSQKTRDLKLATIGSRLCEAIATADLRNRTNSGGKIAQQADPLGDRLAIGSGKGRTRMIRGAGSFHRIRSRP